MMPSRIQRRRTKGWIKPEGAVYVGRGSKWGNPAKVVKESGGWHVDHDKGGSVGTFPNVDEAAAFAVRLFKAHLERNPHLVADARRGLAGRDLMCWCPEGQPCHADVLLEIANGGAS